MTAARIVIVGASLGGVRTAQALRSAGFDGQITVLDPQSHLPYDKPPLSKRLLSGAFTADQIRLVPGERLDSLGLDLRLGTGATGLDVEGREVHTDAGAVPYDAVVIATGAVPRWIKGWPHLPGLHVLRSLDDSHGLHEALTAGGRLVVVGGGFIGLEAAATARSMGVEVTVIEPMPAPLIRGLGERMGLVMADLHRSRGVDLRLSTGVTEPIVVDGRAVGVRLNDGTELEAGAVLVGVGARPATDWLETSALVIDDGVVCDPCLQAADRVWAVGDVCRWGHHGVSTRLEHWTNAAEQGQHVAGNVLAELAGQPTTPFTTVPFVWSDQYEAKVQVLGQIDGGDDIEVIAGSTDEHKFVALYGRDGKLQGALGVSMPKVLMPFRKLLLDGASWSDALAAAPAP